MHDFPLRTETQFCDMHISLSSFTIFSIRVQDKECGPDGIPAAVLKRCVSELNLVLSLKSTSCFSICFKIFVVSFFLLIRGNVLFNYRPIELLPLLLFISTPNCLTISSCRFFFQTRNLNFRDHLLTG